MKLTTTKNDPRLPEPLSRQEQLLAEILEAIQDMHRTLVDVHEMQKLKS